MARRMGLGGQGEAAIPAAVEDGQGDRALHLADRTGRLQVCRYLVEDLRLDVNQLYFLGTMGASSSSSLATTRLPHCILHSVPRASKSLIIVAGEVRSQVRSYEAYQQRVAYVL